MSALSLRPVANPTSKTKAVAPLDHTPHHDVVWWFSPTVSGLIPSSEMVIPLSPVVFSLRLALGVFRSGKPV